MAVAVRNRTQGGNDGAAELPITLPVHVTGDLLLVATSFEGAFTPPTPSGWQMLATFYSGTGSAATTIGIVGRVATSASETLPQVLPSGRASTFLAWAISGHNANPTDILGSIAANATAGASGITFLPATTNAANTYLGIGLVALGSAAASTIPTQVQSGWTQFRTEVAGSSATGAAILSSEAIISGATEIDPPNLSRSSNFQWLSVTLAIPEGIVAEVRRGSGTIGFSLGLSGHGTALRTGAGAGSVGFQVGVSGHGTGATPTGPIYGPTGTNEFPLAAPSQTHQVAATWTAISTQITTCQGHSGVCRIEVAPGTLPGGSGFASGSSGVVQNVGSASKKILVTPRDGYGTVNVSGTGLSFVGIAGIYFDRIDFSAIEGVMFRNILSCGLGHTKVNRFLSTANGSNQDDLLMVEVVMGPVMQTDMGVDRSEFKTANGYTMNNVKMVGCYIAPHWKPEGSSAHNDSIQIEAVNGGGALTNFHYEKTVMFRSADQGIQSAGSNGGVWRDSAFFGWGVTQVRYPLYPGGDPPTLDNTLNGTWSGIDAERVIVGGSIASGYTFTNSANNRVSTATARPGWTQDSSLASMTTAQLEAIAPYPTDARLMQIWNTPVVVPPTTYPVSSATVATSQVTSAPTKQSPVSSQIAAVSIVTADPKVQRAVTDQTVASSTVSAAPTALRPVSSVTAAVSAVSASLNSAGALSSLTAAVSEAVEVAPSLRLPVSALTVATSTFSTTSPTLRIPVTSLTAGAAAVTAAPTKLARVDSVTVAVSGVVSAPKLRAQVQSLTVSVSQTSGSASVENRAEVPGTSGIEVEIYKDSAPFDKIAVIEARQAPTILREILAEGAGSFQVAKNNHKVLSDPTLLEYRNFVRVRVNGLIAGGFVIKNKNHTIVGKGEQKEEAWAISGEGLRSWGKDAVVHPPKGISKNSREARFFNFASEQGAWYNPAQWSNATVVWDWNQGGNWWQTAPADWPDAPTAKWIWDRNNSSYAMPNGDVYFRYEVNLSETGQYAFFFAVDDAAELYVDGDLVHTTAEHAWQETTRKDFDLEAGWHVIALRATQNVLNSPGGLIGALYKIGDATTPTAARLIAVTDSSWKVCGYPAVPPGWTPGNILLTLLAEAAAHGVRFAENWTPTFTETHDSDGVAWGDPLSISFDVGSTNYEDVFKALEEVACDIYLDADTLELHVWKKRGIDRSVEGTAFNPIILRVGHNLLTADEKGQADIVNTLLLKTADGWEIVQPSAGDSVAKYGVVEGQIATDMSGTAASKLVDEVFKKKALPEKTATFELIPVPGMVPFEDFFEGDYVSAPGEVPGVLEKRRIMSISVTENNVGDPVYAIEFDAIFGDRTDDLAKMLSKATHSSALGGGFTGSTGTPQTPTQGSNPQLPVAAAPEAPTGLVVNTVGRWSSSGTAVADFGLTWNGVISNVNNLPVNDIESYEVWGRKSSDPNYALMVTVFDSYAYLSDFNPGDEWYFQVRAISRTGGYGNFSEPAHLVADAPIVPLGQPSAPTLITELGSVAIRWDGLISGSPAPSRFKHIEIQRSTSQAGTYTTIGSFVSGSGTDTTGVVGTTYWYRLIAVDYLGVKSTPSLAVSIKVAGVSTAELDDAINDAISGAQQTADNAVTAANGKNKTTYSNNAPTTSNVGTAGDTWYRRDATTGQIIGIWENTGGSTWVPRALTGANLVEINAGTVTAGTFFGDRFAANSISSEKVLIANLDNQLDNPNFETNSFIGWLLSGNTTGWETPSSAAGDVNRYLRRATTTARGVGHVTNIFKAEVRPRQRLRIDALSFNEGIVPGTWTELRRNFFQDPLATDYTTPYWGTPAAGTYSNVTDMTGSVETAVRFTRTTTAAAATHRFIVGDSLPRGTVRVRMRVRSSVALTASLVARPDVTSATNQVTMSGSLAIPAGVSEINVSASAGTFTATAASGIVLTLASGMGAIGMTLDVTNVTIEPNSTSTGEPFSGDSEVGDTDLARFAWIGAPNASQSIYQTRIAPSSIGVQFYDSAKNPLSYSPRVLDTTGTWTPLTWETSVPPNAYFASLRIEDSGAANSTLRLANLQFRVMGAGQLVVDGDIYGRHIATDTLESRNIKAGAIEVDRLSPTVGSSLNLDGNTNINALTSTGKAQQDAITAQQQRLDSVGESAENAAAAASSASAAASAVQAQANTLQAGIQTAQQGIDDLGRTYRFSSTGAFVGAPDSPYEFVIQNTGAEIRYNGVPVSSWDAGQMIVESFVGNEVVLGNHKLEKDPGTGGTVVRKIVSN